MDDVTNASNNGNVLSRHNQEEERRDSYPSSNDEDDDVITNFSSEISMSTSDDVITNFGTEKSTSASDDVSPPWHVGIKLSDSHVNDDLDDGEPDEFDLEDAFEYYNELFSKDDDSPDSDVDIDDLIGYQEPLNFEVVFDEIESSKNLVSSLAKKRIGEKIADENKKTRKKVSFLVPTDQVEEKQDGADDVDQFENRNTPDDVTEVKHDVTISFEDKTEEISEKEETFLDDAPPSDQTTDSPPDEDKQEEEVPQSEAEAGIKRNIDHCDEDRIDLIVKPKKKKKRPSVQQYFADLTSDGVTTHDVTQPLVANGQNISNNDVTNPFRVNDEVAEIIDVTTVNSITVDDVGTTTSLVKQRSDTDVIDDVFGDIDFDESKVVSDDEPDDVASDLSDDNFEGGKRTRLSFDGGDSPFRRFVMRLLNTIVCCYVSPPSYYI